MLIVIGLFVLAALACWIVFAVRKAKKRQRRFEIVSEGVTKAPTHPVMQKQMLGFVVNNLKFADVAYRQSLDCLQESNGDAGIRAFALELGRSSYASKRPDKKLAMYDEQAIQNDLQAHSGR